MGKTQKTVTLYHHCNCLMSPLSNLNTMRTPSPKNASEVRTFASDFRTPLEKVSITSKFLTTCNRTQIPACRTQNIF